MDHNLNCYRCGMSLESLSMPLSRRDSCPGCAADLHSCAMCVFFDPAVPGQCREDGAEEVKEKELANFCDWFKPSDNAFDAERKREADDARQALDALFGDDESKERPAGSELSDAESLFK